MCRKLAKTGEPSQNIPPPSLMVLCRIIGGGTRKRGIASTAPPPLTAPPPPSAHLSEHDGGVPVEEGDAGQALAALERLDDHRLAGLKDDLGHLVSLEDGGLVQLLAAGLLADLPVDLRGA